MQIATHMFNAFRSDEIYPMSQSKRVMVLTQCCRTHYCRLVLGLRERTYPGIAGEEQATAELQDGGLTGDSRSTSIGSQHHVERVLHIRESAASYYAFRGKSGR